jgi:hypothetical protein
MTAAYMAHAGITGFRYSLHGKRTDSKPTGKPEVQAAHVPP